MNLKSLMFTAVAVVLTFGPAPILAQEDTDMSCYDDQSNVLMRQEQQAEMHHQYHKAGTLNEAMAALRLRCASEGRYPAFHTLGGVTDLIVAAGNYTGAHESARAHHVAERARFLCHQALSMTSEPRLVQSAKADLEELRGY